MRLQLAAFVLASSSVFAQQEPEHAEVALRSSLYQDDDATTISTSTVAVRGFAGDVTISARYLVDVTSSASVDVVTAATGRWDEDRHEATGGVAWADGTTTLSADYIYSTEHDWDSHTGNLGVARDFLNHNLTLSLGGSYVYNQVGRAKDQSFQESMSVLGIGAGAVIVGSPRDVVAIRYSLAHLDGYQASPYRFAFHRAPTGQVVHSEETHPEKRNRHAVALLWNRHVWSDAALRSHMRLYLDDWGVMSVTAGTELIVGVGHLEIAAHVRGYGQMGATFYEQIYAERREHMTADRELSTFFDVFGGLRVGWVGKTPNTDRLRFELEVTGFGFWFPEFDRLPRRRGLIAELGMEVGF